MDLVCIVDLDVNRVYRFCLLGSELGTGKSSRLGLISSHAMLKLTRWDPSESTPLRWVRLWLMFPVAGAAAVFRELSPFS